MTDTVRPSRHSSQIRTSQPVERPMLSRRLVLNGAAALAGSALAAPFLSRSASARNGAPFTQPRLPYGEDALAPVISPRTVELHYGAHHAGYFKNLNRMVEGTDYADMSLEDVVVRTKLVPADAGLFNQAGQAWNHIVYWDQMTPGGPDRPEGDLAIAIDTDFGSFDEFRRQLVDTSVKVFGSGWGWLVQEADGSLGLMATANGDNPLAHGKTALIGFDVWEHAYYLDYQNRRRAHVEAVFDRLINWSKVAERMVS